MREYTGIIMGLVMYNQYELPFDIFDMLKSPPIKTTKPIDWRSVQNQTSAQQYFHDSTKSGFYLHNQRSSKSKDNNYSSRSFVSKKTTKAQRISRFEKILSKKRTFKTDYLVNQVY
jgi:hypothetical protein